MFRYQNKYLTVNRFNVNAVKVQTQVHQFHTAQCAFIQLEVFASLRIVQMEL